MRVDVGARSSTTAARSRLKLPARASLSHRVHAIARRYLRDPIKADSSAPVLPVLTIFAIRRRDEPTKANHRHPDPPV
jgi:hypothetical protein